MKDRRIDALHLSRQRRERLDASLRRVLDGQQSERTAQLQRCDAYRAELDSEAAALRSLTQKLDEMTSEAKMFALAEFNRSRDHLGRVAERYCARVAEFERENAALEARDVAIAQTRQKIAANRARREVIGRQVRDVVRELDGVEADQADEETQEIAVARFAYARRRTA